MVRMDVERVDGPSKRTFRNPHDETEGKMDPFLLEGGSVRKGRSGCLTGRNGRRSRRDRREERNVEPKEARRTTKERQGIRGEGNEPPFPLRGDVSAIVEDRGSSGLQAKKARRTVEGPWPTTPGPTVESTKPSSPTSHHTTSHYITPHHITYHRIAPHHIALHHTTSHHTT